MKASRQKGPAPDDISRREQQVLAAAAALFARKGYLATTVRDIGQEVGLLGGSLYHYIKSKEALFVKLHEMALQQAEDRIRKAIAPVDDPWERMTIACTTLLEIQLDPHSLTMPLMNDFRSVPRHVREQLIVRRDSFEQLFKDLVAGLPLDAQVDATLYRLLLLTILNNSSLWYKPGKLTPEEIGRQIMLLFGREKTG
jgi:AcrR family transcriptional regulator